MWQGAWAPASANTKDRFWRYTKWGLSCFISWVSAKRLKGGFAAMPVYLGKQTGTAIQKSLPCHLLVALNKPPGLGLCFVFNVFSRKSNRCCLFLPRKRNMMIIDALLNCCLPCKRHRSFARKKMVILCLPQNKEHNNIKRGKGL